MLKTVNQGRAQQNLPPLTNDSLHNYIRGLAAMQVYQVTPTVFFDDNYHAVYPLARKIVRDQWWNVHRALHAIVDRDGPLSWTQPFAEDQIIRDTEHTFSRLFSQLGFVSGTSILSIDDDQFRLRSTLVEQMGFPRINHPKKTFGPMSTGVVELNTGITLALRLTGKASRVPV